MYKEIEVWQGDRRQKRNYLSKRVKYLLCVKNKRYSMSQWVVNQSFWEGLSPAAVVKTDAKTVPEASSASSLHVLMMRCVSVCVRGEWLRVPLGEPSTSVRALGTDALQRYQRVKGRQDGEGSVRFSMQRCRGGEILHLDDKSDDVLEDNDFVHMSTSLRLVRPDAKQWQLNSLNYSEMLFVF